MSENIEAILKEYCKLVKKLNKAEGFFERNKNNKAKTDQYTVNMIQLLESLSNCIEELESKGMDVQVRSDNYDLIIDGTEFVASN